MRRLTIANIKTITNSVNGRYVMLTTLDGFSVAVNVAVLNYAFTLPRYANNKQTDRIITNFVSYKECSLHEYISRKVGFV
jgi:riboflavin transporter FmnP